MHRLTRGDSINLAETKPTAINIIKLCSQIMVVFMLGLCTVSETVAATSSLAPLEMT